MSRKTRLERRAPRAITVLMLAGAALWLWIAAFMIGPEFGVDALGVAQSASKKNATPPPKPRPPDKASLASTPAREQLARAEAAKVDEPPGATFAPPDVAPAREEHVIGVWEDRIGSWTQTLRIVERAGMLTVEAQRGEAEPEHAALEEVEPEGFEQRRFIERDSPSGETYAITRNGYLRAYDREGFVSEWSALAKRVVNTRVDAGAQYRLATMYEEGTGVEQDLSRAVHWFRQAANQGHVEAQIALARMYSIGQGVDQDAAWAWVWFDRAATNGHDGAAQRRELLGRRLGEKGRARAAKLSSLPAAGR